MRRLALVSMLGILPLACGSDETSTNADGGTGGGTGSDGGDDGDDGADGSGGSSADGDEGDDGSPPAEPPPATGIQIVDVTADQGVRVQIASNGQLVDGGSRNAALMTGRTTVIRAFYEVDPGYVARDIIAYLTVVQADGTETEHSSYITVLERDCAAGMALIDCRYSALNQGFGWVIPPEEVNPGVKYRIEMLETSPGHEDDASDKIPVFPYDGTSTMIVGIEDMYMKMRVVLVPFEHTVGNDCDPAPELNDPFDPDKPDGPTNGDYFGARLLSHNPADEVELIAHEVVPFSGSMRGSALLGALQELRFSEGAPPEYFYYGVARPCDGGPSFAGVASIGGPSKGSAGQRVGWGVYYGSKNTTANTFIHEIGHEQGLRHIACDNTDAAGPDGSYPDHPDGDLVDPLGVGNWGIDSGFGDIDVHTPLSHDYMTYCGNTFVSEWTWHRVTPWIQEISSWDFEDTGGDQTHEGPKEPLLFGTILEDGTAHWFIAESWFPTTTTGDHAMHFEAGGADLGDLPAVRTEIDHTDDYQIVAKLPSDWTSVTALSLRTPQGEVAVDRSALRFVGPSTTVSSGL